MEFNPENFSDDKFQEYERLYSVFIFILTETGKEFQCSDMEIYLHALGKSLSSFIAYFLISRNYEKKENIDNFLKLIKSNIQNDLNEFKDKV